jgi:hypothetical protein
MGSGMNGRVMTLEVYNGDLIAGGYFTSAESFDVNYVARWNGTSWHGLANDIGKGVCALTVYDSQLIASTVPSRSPGRLVKWDGVSWEHWDSLGRGTGGGIITDFTTFNGLLIAGGDFDRIGNDTYIDSIVCWDGSAWQPLSSGIEGSANALIVYNGELIVGGYFTATGGVDANYIARWDGTSWKPLGRGMNGAVTALAIYNGELIAAGEFTTAGSVDANYIARWDGSTWKPLGSGLNNKVEALEVYNGELIVAGHFSTAGGNISSYWARWGTPDVHTGDLNHDCNVDLADYGRFAVHWQHQACDLSGWCYEADLDYNKKVDLADQSILADNWLSALP